MKIIFDKAKNARNIEERKVSFELANEFDWSAAIIGPDLRKDYQEERFIAVSFIGNRLHVLIYTMRFDALRVISLRKANKREMKKYEKEKTNHYFIDEDSPELTDEFFATARPGLEVLNEQFGPAAVQKFLKSRGRPRKPEPKIQTTLRMDPDILKAFRAMGRGWQTQINKALREWLVSH